MKFDLKNGLDLSIIISVFILILTGAFLRFFKYFFTPVNLEKMTLILIPETLVVFGLLTYKILKGK